MKTRIIVGVLLLIAVLGVGTYTSRAGDVAGRRQWSIVNFVEPVQVKDQIVMGPVLIVHDAEKMSRGEACTTFYRFEPAKGPRKSWCRSTADRFSALPSHRRRSAWSRLVQGASGWPSIRSAGTARRTGFPSSKVRRGP